MSQQPVRLRELPKAFEVSYPPSLARSGESALMARIHSTSDNSRRPINA